ncbi:Sulfofructose kinase [Burkholderiales bacterium]|nr:Sulfofructose kinase [Burkholderiales bacterium]
MPTKVRASAYREVGGGMAANAACAIARLGGRVAFWGRAGDDAAGAAMAQEFAQYGVDAGAFRRLPGCRSSQSAIVIDAGGERLIVSHHGDVPDDASWLPLAEVHGAGAVLADVRWPTGARALFATARDAGVPRVLDADVADGAAIDELLRLADHVVFSEHGLARWASLPASSSEAQCRTALERAWAAMRSRGSASACAVTRGEAGSWWLTGDGPLDVPAPAINAVDTLGAGDVFHGAYALAIAQRRDIASAARFATLAAAIKCTRGGGRAGCPTLAEVAALAARS